MKMSREVSGAFVQVGDRTSGHSEVLNALNTEYSCIHQPQAPAATPDDRRYLTSLSVYMNREVDNPESPLPTSFSMLMVDQSTIDPQMIKEKVTAALTVLSFREPRVLVQFWSPVVVKKRCVLMTLDQPFGLGMADEGLYLYRLDSERRMFAVDGEFREKELEPPGRVYHQKRPEWSLDLHGLSTRQYLQDRAASYNIRGYIDLPVFETSSGCCVGVLELIMSSNYVDYAFEVQEVSRALKEQNLKSPDVFENPSFYIDVGEERRRHEMVEISRALKMVCDIKKLPLAQTWVLSGYSTSVANSENLEQTCNSFNKNCIGKVCMSTSSLPFYIRDLNMWGFHQACKKRHLEKSKGVVGKAMSNHGSCFCRYVTELGEDEYPLVHIARMNGISSCLAIYIKSVEVNVEYVVELILPNDSANKTDLQSLVETVKEQVKNASGVQLGITSSTEVIGEDPFNWDFEFEPPPLPPESPNLQLIGQNGQNTEDNVENESHNYKEPSRKRKRSERSIGLEKIKKHYGKTMEEAAVSLDVSRSTLKRICRSLGIPRWPYSKGPSDLGRGPFDLVGPFPTDSMPSGEPFPATHTKHSEHQDETSIRGKSMVENDVIVKATYGDNTVKFPFSLSQGLLKLEELVAIRFHLKLGRFSLKYRDEEGDVILIACNSDLTGLLCTFRHPNVKTLIKVLVYPVDDDNADD